MSELLPQFKKTFFFPWRSKKWEAPFLALTTIQQKAVINLINRGVDREWAFEALENTSGMLLLNKFDETMEDLQKEYIKDTWTI